MPNAKEPFFEVAAGTAVFREGDPGNEMYIIESGTVEILRMYRGAEPMATLEAGDFFGEMAILEDQPRFATAIAKSHCRLLRIERAAFVDVLRTNVEIPIRIMRKLAGRVRRSEQRAQEAHNALDEFKRKLLSRENSKPEPAPRVADPAPAPAPAEPPPRPSAASAAITAPPPAVSGGARSFELRHGSGTTFVLAAEGEYLVGRPDPVTGINPEINLGPLDVARSLSRRHAKIVLADGQCVVREDVGTTNGTFVNGQRLATGEPVVLQSGDQLKFGSVEIELHVV